MISQAELEQRVLRALFDYSQHGSSQLNSDEIRKLVDGEIGGKRIELAIEALERKRLVYGSYGSMGAHYEITNSGYKIIEQELGITLPNRERSIAPAASGVVSFDHNSRQFEAADSELKKLRDGLEKANDLGDFTEKEAQVAAFEVGQIREYLSQDFMRVREFWARCESTLKWIGEKAAEAVIGAAAIGLLTLLGSLLGIF